MNMEQTSVQWTSVTMPIPVSGAALDLSQVVLERDDWDGGGILAMPSGLRNLSLDNDDDLVALGLRKYTSTASASSLYGRSEYVPFDLEDPDYESEEEMEIAIANCQLLVDLSKQMSLTDEGKQFFADLAEPLERVEQIREEVREYIRENEEYEKEVEERNKCSGVAMSGGILHPNGTHCPKHGSF